MSHELSVLVDGFGFTEGPRWHDGELWFSDFGSRFVQSVTQDGRLTRQAFVLGQPSGIGFAPDGRVLVSSTLDRRVVAFRPGERPDVVADTWSVYGGALNDMVVDALGRAYVSPFNAGVNHSPDTVGRPVSGTPVLLVTDGEVSIAADDLGTPNGIVLTDDGRTLVVAETTAKQLTAFDVAADGSLSGRRVFADLDGRSPDGLCLDASGAVWVGCPFAEEFVRVEEGGRILEAVPTPGRWAVAPALGGADGRTLFCCTATTTLEEYFDGRSRAAIETTTVEVPAPGR
jgi:sugar lactone lactonase YvrE